MMWIVRTRLAGERRGIRLQSIVHAGITQFQEFMIADTTAFGRMLVIDGVPQSAEVDEFYYHETLVQPAMCAVETPTSALVVGGGEGATIREVLKHGTVSRVVMVDIDGELVGACRQHLGSMHQGSFDDPRVELVIAEGRNFLESCDEQFDCIIIDTTDPLSDGPSERLLTVQGLNAARRRLRPGGVLAIQAEPAAPGTSGPHETILRTAESVFATAVPLYSYIPLYGVPYGFIVATDLSRLHVSKMIEETDEILRRRGVTCRHWDGQTALASASVPSHIRRTPASVNAATDEAPLILSRTDLAVVHDRPSASDAVGQ